MTVDHRVGPAHALIERSSGLERRAS